MASIIHNKEVALCVKLLEEVTSHACQLDLRGVGRDEPDLGVKSIKLVKDIVESVQLFFDE